MFAIGDNVFYLGRSVLGGYEETNPVNRYPATIIDIHPVPPGTIAKYTIKFFPVNQQPGKEYPVVDAFSRTIVYDSESKPEKVVKFVIASYLQKYEPPEQPKPKMSDQLKNEIKDFNEQLLTRFDAIEKSPEIKVRTLSETPYYNYFGKQIKKNKSIKEIEQNIKHIKNIQEECLENLEIEWGALNAELALQHSKESGLLKHRMLRTKSAKSKNTSNKSKRTKKTHSS